MNSQENESVKALRTAIEIEDNGLLTYLQFARQSKNETGKNMFIRLAMDEHNHRIILEKQLYELLSKGNLEVIEIPKSEIEKILPAIREKQKRTKDKAELNEVDALNTAFDLERKSAQYYRENAEKSDDKNAKLLFSRLAEWEDSHIDLIQAELDFIDQTGLWFGIPEFYMDGKY